MRAARIGVFSLCMIAFVWAWLGPFPAQAGKVLNDALVSRPFGHHLWQNVLDRFVDSRGAVDFVHLKADPKLLNRYLEQLAAVSPVSHPDYFPNPDAALAYWLNAYNAVTLRQILDVYPIASLDEAPKVFRGERYRLGGQTCGLACIRRNIAELPDAPPAAVFAMSQYTLDSPPVLKHAFEADRLKTQLAEARLQAMGNPAIVTFEPGYCMGLGLSRFVQGVGPMLGRMAARDAEPAEDQDAIEDSGEVSQPLLPGRRMEVFVDEQNVPVEASLAMHPDWAARLRPLAPPSATADLGKTCSHPVHILPPDRRLREVEPF